MATDYLAGLERRRSELIRRIQDLNGDLRQVEAMIRQENIDIYIGVHEIKKTKKNYMQLLVWARIRQFLIEENRKNKGKGLRTRDIYQRMINDNADVKYTTLRSHIHRLKKEDRIYQESHSGMWRLTDSRVEDGQ